MTLVTDAVAGARRAAPGTTTSVDGGQDADRTADERSYPDEQEAGAWASVISEEASTVISRRPSRRAAVRLGCWRAACTAEGDISAGPITCRFVGPTGRQLFDDAVRLLRCEVESSFGEVDLGLARGSRRDPHRRGDRSQHRAAPRAGSARLVPMPPEIAGSPRSRICKRRYGDTTRRGVPDAPTSLVRRIASRSDSCE